MKAFVDPELCIGCTQCAGLCPEVYQMEGTLAVAIPGDIPKEAERFIPQSLFSLGHSWYTIGCEIMEWRTTSYAFTGH